MICEYMFCLFLLAWKKQQYLQQGCKYLLGLSNCKVGGWSIYPPDPVPLELSVASESIDSQLL